MPLGPWNKAALTYELRIHGGSFGNSAYFVGGMVMGMLLAMQHPEYAQAAVQESQAYYEQEKPDGEKMTVGVERFIQAVPIEVQSEEAIG